MTNEINIPIDQSFQHGETPLDLALQMNYDDVVDLLRKKI